MSFTDEHKKIDVFINHDYINNEHYLFQKGSTEIVIYMFGFVAKQLITSFLNSLITQKGCGGSLKICSTRHKEQIYEVSKVRFHELFMCGSEDYKVR